jgi:AcrR family transcriptional regulator
MESTRDRILDAAASLMHEHGLARATTKQIARTAGCSEGLLYRYFSDKQEIFLAVLSERIPPIPRPDELVGTASVHDNLTRIVAALLGFYRRTFPMAASIFSERDLLARWREGLAARGAGPRGPVAIVRLYLDAEQATGRIDPRTDTDAVAVMLTGSALLEGFLAAFEDRQNGDDDALARRLVTAIAPAYTPPTPEGTLA